MGGINGMNSATAFEDAFAATRGHLSGIFQQGYPFGYHRAEQCFGLQAVLPYWLLFSMPSYQRHKCLEFSVLAHDGHDLYPTFLELQLKFSNNLVTSTIVVGNCGSIVGEILSGYFSIFFGRRLTFIIVFVIGAAIIPAVILSHDPTIIAMAKQTLKCPRLLHQH
jgi:SHS family lactate transporter-like MFS transporter